MNNPYSMENFLEEMFPAVLIIAALIAALMILGSFCQYLILVWEEKHKPRRNTLALIDIVHVLFLEWQTLPCDHELCEHYKKAVYHLSEIHAYYKRLGDNVTIPKVVEKDIYSCYFKEIKQGKKTFEIRKDKDDIQIGDILVLREVDELCGYTGYASYHKVKGVFRDGEKFGLKRGYCIISISEGRYNEQ